MTANGNCAKCGVITGWYDAEKKQWLCQEHVSAGQLADAEVGTMSKAKASEGTGTCVACSESTSLFLRYAGWPVGWFCEAHRMDKTRDATVDQLLDLFKKDSDGKTVFPREWMQKKHPYHQVAAARVAAGSARWADVKAVMVPGINASLNRAQRRAMMRKLVKQQRKEK